MIVSQLPTARGYARPTISDGGQGTDAPCHRRRCTNSSLFQPVPAYSSHPLPLLARPRRRAVFYQFPIKTTQNEAKRMKEIARISAEITISLTGGSLPKRLGQRAAFSVDENAGINIVASEPAVVHFQHVEDIFVG